MSFSPPAIAGKLQELQELLAPLGIRSRCRCRSSRARPCRRDGPHVRRERDPQGASRRAAVADCRRSPTIPDWKSMRCKARRASTRRATPASTRATTTICASCSQRWRGRTSAERTRALSLRARVHAVGARSIAADLPGELGRPHHRRRRAAPAASATTRSSSCRSAQSRPRSCPRRRRTAEPSRQGAARALVAQLRSTHASA